MNSKRSELVRYWLAKADDSLDTAKIVFEAGKLAFAVNRLYYTLFYAVTAVLLATNGQTYSKHSGVRAALHRDLISTGLLDANIGRLYDALFNARQMADYGPFAEFSENVIKQQISDVEKALHALKSLAERYP